MRPRTSRLRWHRPRLRRTVGAPPGSPVPGEGPDLPYLDTLSPEARQKLEAVAPRPAFYDGRYWEVFEGEAAPVNDTALEALGREEYVETATRFLFEEAERRGTYPVDDEELLGTRRPICRAGEMRNCYVWTLPGLRQLQLPSSRFPRLSAAAEELPSNWLATIARFYYAGTDPDAQSRALVGAPVIPQQWKRGVEQAVRVYGEGFGRSSTRGAVLLPYAAQYLRENRTPEELRHSQLPGHVVQGLIVELEDLRSWLQTPKTFTYQAPLVGRIGTPAHTPAHVPLWVPDYTRGAWQERALAVYLLRLQDQQRLPSGVSGPAMLETLQKAAVRLADEQVNAQLLTLFRPLAYRQPLYIAPDKSLNLRNLQLYLVDELMRVRQFMGEVRCLWDLPGLARLKPAPPADLLADASPEEQIAIRGDWTALQLKACADPAGFLEVLDYVWQAGQSAGPSQRLRELLGIGGASVALGAATAGVSLARMLKAAAELKKAMATVRLISTVSKLSRLFAWTGVGALAAVATWLVADRMLADIEKYLTSWVNPELRERVARWVDGTGISPEQFWFWATTPCSASGAPDATDTCPDGLCEPGNLVCNTYSYWRAAWGDAGRAQAAARQAPGFERALAIMLHHQQQLIDAELKLNLQIANMAPEEQRRVAEREAAEKAAAEDLRKATDILGVGPGGGCQLSWLPFPLPAATPQIGGVLAGGLAYGALSLLPSFGSRWVDAAKGAGAVGAGIWSWYALAGACGQKKEADEALSSVVGTAVGLGALLVAFVVAWHGVGTAVEARRTATKAAKAKEVPSEA